jgi:hypothetical protein
MVEYYPIIIQKSMIEDDTFGIVKYLSLDNNDSVVMKQKFNARYKVQAKVLTGCRKAIYILR